VRIASWNVNSVRSRLDQLTAWLARSAPDVLCMQETKVEDDLFPHAALAEVGYRAVTFGQKTYNGVAIAAKLGLAIEDVKRNLDGDPPDAQRRLIAATIEGVRVVDVYVPNGQAVGTPAFTYKLEWLDRLHRDLAAHCAPQQDILVCGDFNVAPEPIDVHDPRKWEGSLLFTGEERAALRRLLTWGLVDVCRDLHKDEPGLYSWWDYRMGAFRKNRGLRIDLALCTPALAARCLSATIDKRPRELERPSDHAPVVVEIA
jgi:exodeoxyribonuclease III